MKPAKEMYAEWETSFKERKRELKEKNKERTLKMNNKEKVNFRISLLQELKEQYIATLQRNLMEPAVFARCYKGDSEDHAYVIYTNFAKFKEIYAAAEEIQYQKPID